MEKNAKSGDEPETAVDLLEMLHVDADGVKFGLNKLDYRRIVEDSLESKRFQNTSIPAVADGSFAEEPACGAIVKLAHLIKDKESFHAFWGALYALVPGFEVHAYCEWPTRVGAGVASAKRLKQYILKYCGGGDLMSHPNAPNMLLALALADAVCLGLMERERQLMAVKNGGVLLEQIA